MNRIIITRNNDDDDVVTILSVLHVIISLLSSFRHLNRVAHSREQCRVIINVIFLRNVMLSSNMHEIDYVELCLPKNGQVTLQVVKRTDSYPLRPFMLYKNRAVPRQHITCAL